jgi:hypothetical protein
LPPADPEAPGGEPLPESVAEALARAQRHARRALAESLAAAEALLDAASLAATGGAAADGPGALGSLVGPLAQLREWLDPDGGRDPAALLDGLFEVLDAEIARWEARSRNDPDARAVLRAFLAVREVLWEVGRRGAATGADGAPDPAPRREPARSARRSGGRVRRVSVEG